MSKYSLLILLNTLLFFQTNALAQLNCEISLERSNSSSSSGSPVGQSFTACQTGTFSNLSVWHGAINSNGSNVTLSIYKGESVNNPIYTQFIGDLPGVTLFNPKRTIELSSPVAVVEGQQYTFVFTGNLNLVNFQKPGDVYSGGRLYSSEGFDASGRDYTFALTIIPGVNTSPENNVEVNNEIASGDYLACETIKTIGEVVVTGQANFKAGQSILLQAGFHAVEGSEFTAIIEPCEATLVTAEPRSTDNSYQTTNSQLLKNAIIPYIEPSLYVYPNPFTNSTTAHFYLTKESPIHFQVYSTNGQLKLNKSNQLGVVGWNELLLNASDFSAGTYILEVITNTKVFTKQVIVVK